MFIVEKQRPARVILVALCLVPIRMPAQETTHLTEAQGKALLD